MEAALAHVARAALTAYDLPPELSLRPIRPTNNAATLRRAFLDGYRSVRVLPRTWTAICPC
ncbi:MAG: hypothetical protein ACRDL2_12520 [Gaiellaceae bacterium]